MKILIVSDTHGRLENLERVIEMTKPIDALIHLGDVEGQEDYIRRLVPCAAYMSVETMTFFPCSQENSSLNSANIKC